MQKLLAALNTYRESHTGNLSVILALAMMPLALAMGAAIDFGRYVSAQTEMVAALDAASIAAAVDSGGSKSDSQLQAIAQQVFKANLRGGTADGLETKATFTIKGGAVVGEAHANLNTAFMTLAGINNMDVVAQNAINMPNKGKAEIVLVLDFSGSMAELAGGQVKYIAMAKAANQLIDSVSSNPDRVKIGLVPFSQAVYGTIHSLFVKGATGSSWTGCTQDQTFPYNISGNAPIPTVDASKWGQTTVSKCADYVSDHLQMRPLTNDFAGLKTQINAARPYANTHVPLGAEMGYQMLSPMGAFPGAASYSDTQTKKFLVLLTDGTQTEPAFGPGGSRTVPQGDSNLEQICSNMKDDGITVMTIAYDLDDNSQQKRLKNCASDASKNFFVVNSGADVTAAFQSITAEVNKVAYLSK